MAIPHKIMSRPFLAQWLGLGLALFILFVIIVINLYRDYGRTAEREQERLSSQARVIAENIEFQLSTVNFVLERVLDEMAGGDHMLIAKGAARSSYLAALIEAMPGMRSIGLLDAHGIMLASNRKELVGKDLAYRDYVSTVKQHPDIDMLYVSPPFRSILNPYIMNITRMIPDSKGEFNGMVTITLDPEYFSTLMASVLYAPDMWDTLIHADGQVFLMEPGQNDVAGTSLAQPGSLFARHQDSGQQATVMTGHALAVNSMQMLAQRTINPERLKMDKPLVIAVGRGTKDIYALWKSDMMFRELFFLLTSVLACLALRAYQGAQRRFDRETASSAADLQTTQDNFQLIVENTADLVVKMDTNGCFTYLNPAFCELFGATHQHFLGKHYGRAVVAADSQIMDGYFKQLFQPPYAVDFTQREKTAKGIRYLQWMAKALFDRHGSITEIIAIGRDMTTHMHQMDALQDQANRDFLTGLTNRRYFIDLGQEELHRAQRYNKPLSLLMLDIDHFKHINDAYGHRVGDMVLQAISKTLLKTLRTIDIVGRVGGEEFAVLLPETPLHEASEVAQRLRDAIAATKVTLDNGAVLQATASIGLAATCGDSTLDRLLDLADAALYQAKQTGRNKVCFSDASLVEAAQARRA